jgi:hypothetical protein
LAALAVRTMAKIAFEADVGRKEVREFCVHMFR